MLTSPFVSPCSAWGWFIQFFRSIFQSGRVISVLSVTLCFPAPVFYRTTTFWWHSLHPTARGCSNTQSPKLCKHKYLFNCSIFLWSQNTTKANKFGEFCSERATIFCWMKRLVIVSSDPGQVNKDWGSLEFKGYWAVHIAKFKCIDWVSCHYGLAKLGFCSQQWDWESTR